MRRGTPRAAASWSALVPIFAVSAALVVVAIVETTFVATTRTRTNLRTARIPAGSVRGRERRDTADLLRVAARQFPEREAYVHGEKRATYAWLDRAADGFAATLLDLGVQPGRRRVPDARLVDQVRRVLPRGAPRRGDHLRDQPPPRRARAGEHPRPHASGRDRPRRRSRDPGRGRRRPCAPRLRAQEALGREPLPERGAPDTVADGPRVHRLDQRHDRRARRARSTTTSAWSRSRATWASSPNPATGGSSSSRSRTSAT